MLQSLQEEKRENTRNEDIEEITKNNIKEFKTILTINPVLPEPGKTLVVRRPRKNNNTLPLVEFRLGLGEVRRLPLGD